MATDTGLRPHPSVDAPGTELVDLDDAEAVARALALHRAGQAVFSIPFNSKGNGTLAWLDPRQVDTESRGR
jgi:hypothetical protein